MKLVKSLLLFCFILFFGQSQAQDIHWTMFDMSPLTLNPAFTGDYEGTFRVGGIYRDQWNSFGVDGFKTPSFYVDAPILMVGKRSWLAVGGMLYNDEAGSNGLTTLSTMGSAAIHIALDKKSKSIFTIGLQGGMVQRRLKTENLLFDDQIVLDGSGGANNLDFGQSMNASVLGTDPEKSFLDFSGGLKLTSELSKTSDVTVGMTFRHITTPKGASLYTTENDAGDQPLLFTLHGRLNVALNKKWNLSPAFIFNKISSSNEIGIQALLGYNLDTEKQMALHFGPGYRMIDNDAVEAILRFDYKQFRVGAAYDFNVSSLSSVSGGKGGFEIAASYIARIYKKPTVKPVIFCPKF